MSDQTDVFPELPAAIILGLLSGHNVPIEIILGDGIIDI